MAVFEDYYSQLYSQPTITDGRLLGQKFLKSVDMPKVTEGKLEDLNGPSGFPPLKLSETSWTGIHSIPWGMHLPIFKYVGPV